MTILQNIRYGKGDPLKRYAPEEKLRYGSERYGQGGKFGRTTVFQLKKVEFKFFIVRVSQMSVFSGKLL